MNEPDTIALSQQRERTDNILVDSGMSERIWNCIMNGEFVLKPGLDISSDVGAQHDVMNVLKSFCPNYLRLVLEAVFNTRIVCASESAFTEQLTALAKTNIFTSPEIVKNKAYVFTRGTWLTEEGKKAVEKHFFHVICMILYLMEECLREHVIPDSNQMFKQGAQFETMQDVFSFLSREIIGGKTLFPKIMAKIGFIPTYVTPAISITPSGSVASVTPVYVTPVEDHRVQKRLALEMRKDSHVRGLYEQLDHSLLSSFVDRTHTITDKLGEQAGVFDSVKVLFNQLKETADFLVNMLHLLGLEDDAKIKLIAQKINELQFEFQKADEFSTQMAAEILQISAELSNIGLEIEQSVQNNCIGGQSQIKPSEELIAGLEAKVAELDTKNDELIKQSAELVMKNSELVTKNSNFKDHIDHIQQQMTSLTSENDDLTSENDDLRAKNDDLMAKYLETMDLIKERDKKLQDQENTINQLRVEVDKPRLPEGLGKNIEEHLENIYSTLSDVTNKHM